MQTYVCSSVYSYTYVYKYELAVLESCNKRDKWLELQVIGTHFLLTHLICIIYIHTNIQLQVYMYICIYLFVFVIIFTIKSISRFGL